MLIQNKKVKNLLSSYERIWSLNYLNTLVGWDTETYMPEDGVEPRARVMSHLSSIIQDAILDKNFIKILESTKDENNLNIYEKKIISVLNKQLKFYKCLPKKFVEDYSKLIASASTVWAKSKQDNDISRFLPVLGDIFQKTRQKAEYLLSLIHI